MDQDIDFFDKLFNPFFLKMVVLNFNFKSNITPNEKEKKAIKCLKTIIPIFNRLMGEKITIHDVLNDDKKKDEVLSENLNNPESMFIERTTTQTAPQITYYSYPQNNNTVNEKIVSNDDDEKDEEGDLKVKEFVSSCIERLNKSVNNKWFTVSDDESYSGSEHSSVSNDTETNNEIKNDVVDNNFTNVNLNDNEIPKLITYDNLDQSTVRYEYMF